MNIKTAIAVNNIGLIIVHAEVPLFSSSLLLLFVGVGV